MAILRTVAINKDYIKELAAILEEEYAGHTYDMSSATVVFAGKRPALFLKRELAKRIGRSFIPPRCISVDNLVKEVNVSDKDLINDLDSAYEIFLIAKDYAPAILKGSKSFAAFLPWAREILAFIDQLDLEMISNEDLDKIEATAAIGYEVPVKINELLSHIVVIRNKFHEYLEENSSCSRALSYLQAAKHAAEYAKQSSGKFYFCNFYYLSHCEAALLRSIADNSSSEYIFHGSPQDWPRLQDYEKEFKQKLDCEKIDHRAIINYHACFDRHAQVVRVRDIIKNVENIDNTLLLLPDTESLVPTLSELSCHLDDFNVSMGYPLWRSSLYSLIMLLFELRLSKKNKKIYTKDYLRVITHPLIKNLSYLEGEDNSASITRILIHKLEEFLLGTEQSEIAGSAFINFDEIESLDILFEKSLAVVPTVTKEDLKHIINSIHRDILCPWENLNSFSDFVEIIRKLLNALLDRAHIDRYPINRKMLETLFDLCDDWDGLGFAEISFDVEQIYLIVKEMLKSQKVSFIGSPLKGLQVLGLFESRSLNFENVIIMDLNEGVLPKIEVNQPLIPTEVMVQLGLSRVSLEEEIQRYNFKRLISSAKHVDLLFTDNDKKSRSRYVEMLLWEEEKNQNKLNVSAFSKTAFVVDVTARQELVYKTPEMIEYMKNVMTHSASSIKTYLDCPMCFYYRYILNLYEKEDLLDEPDARHIGTFVHELLEEAYKPFQGDKIVIDDKFIDGFFKLFDSRFAKYIQKNMKSEGFLLKRIMEYRLRCFVEYEQNRQISTLVDLEKTLYDTLDFSAATLKFVAKIDRVELVDDTLLILDYKTGNAEIKSKKRQGHVINTSDRDSIKKSVGSFQLPIYLFLANKFYENPIKNAGLYDIKSSKINTLFDSIVPEQTELILNQYHSALDVIITEMLDPDVPFTADKSREHTCI